MAHVIYVRDERTGRVFYVGERASLESAEDTAALYNRDPIQRGFFYVVSTR